LLSFTAPNRFVGGVNSGKNIAGLYSLVATCEARAINPFEDLTDVLLRVRAHPRSRIDELLALENLRIFEL
jgi:hypothetical protein